jgi:hypothetical protein
MFTIHAHPTLAEAMLDGFGAVEGMAINVWLLRETVSIQVTIIGRPGASLAFSLATVPSFLPRLAMRECVCNSPDFPIAGVTLHPSLPSSRVDGGTRQKWLIFMHLRQAWRAKCGDLKGLP